MTEVDVANRALGLLSQGQISSFDDDENGPAYLCKQYYEQSRNSIMRSHTWNCAIKRIVLSPLKDAPAFGYSHQFQLPSDWLRVLSIGSGCESLGYVVEGNKILSNTNKINLLYIFKNTDANTWDELLLECVYTALAAKIAYAITKSTSKEESLKNDLELLLRKARSVNGQENPPQELGGYPLLMSRF